MEKELAYKFIDGLPIINIIKELSNYDHCSSYDDFYNKRLSVMNNNELKEHFYQAFLKQKESPISFSLTTTKHLFESFIHSHQ